MYRGKNLRPLALRALGQEHLDLLVSTLVRGFVYDCGGENSSVECSIYFKIRPLGQISKVSEGAIAVRGKDRDGHCCDRCPWFEKGQCLVLELYKRADPVNYSLFLSSPEPHVDLG